MPELAWSHGRAELSPTAAMLVSGRFRLPHGWFSPFAESTWDAGDPAIDDLPGHLRVLGGEFVCVPFGSASAPADATAGWDRFGHVAADDPPHGPSADEDWRVETAEADHVAFSLDYPAGSPIERLERTVRGVAGRPELEFTLTLHARRRALLPVGLHPIFRMPQSPASVRISADFAAGFGYPGALDGAVVPAGAEFDDLSRAAPGKDLSRLPLDGPTETVVLLTGGTGPVRLTYPEERATVALEWDRALLPSLMIWISDRVLDGAPWNRSYRGIGVEPVAAAFDLPSGISAGENPLRRRGIATAVRLDPRRPVVLRSSISASAEGFV